MTSQKKQAQAVRIAELERKLEEALAGQAHVYHFAIPGIKKAGHQQMSASGVILTLTALGGRKICDPVLIRDGLSPETIAALTADMVRSYELATVYKPVA